jgi:hypothetical protein
VEEDELSELEVGGRRVRGSEGDVSEQWAEELEQDGEDEGFGRFGAGIGDCGDVDNVGYVREGAEEEVIGWQSLGDLK